MFKYLFFDDTLLHLRDNVKRCYGKPIVDNVYFDGRVSANLGMAFVVKCDDNKYRMLYHGKNIKTGEKNAYLAVSDDGIHFEPEDVTEISNDKERCGKEKHEVITYKEITDGVVEIACLIKDDYNNPEERYKLLYCEADVKNVMMEDKILVSKDLVNWRELEGVRWNKGTEPITGAFYNNFKKCFTIITRPFWGMRMVGFINTKDFREFTDFQMCLHADSLDKPLEEIYGMPSFEYDGYYIGFPYIYGEHKEIDKYKYKYDSGTMKCQLAYSLNGNNWQRSLRDMFIDGSDEEAFKKAGYKVPIVWPSSLNKVSDDKIAICACTDDVEHGDQLSKTDGGRVFVYTLRSDGIIMLKSDDKQKESCVMTRENIFDGGDIHINIKAKKATVAIRKCEGVNNWHSNSEYAEGFTHEDCIVFEGDLTDWVVKFKNGRSLDEFKGKSIIVEVKFYDGELYSIWGEFLPVLNSDGLRYRRHKTIPPRERQFYMY